jgi:hypothetical protein
MVSYKGWEIRLYVRGPIFKERIFSAAFEILRTSPDRRIAGSVTGTFAIRLDAENAALNAAIKAIDGDKAGV